MAREMPQPNRLELKLRAQNWTADGTVGTNIDVLIDEAPLADYGNYATNLLSLVPSVDYDGDFFMVVCTCGDAGCAGIVNPITVTHQSGRVDWHVPEPEPVRDFSFDEDQYRVEIVRLVDEGTLLASDGKLTDAIPENNQQFLERNPALLENIGYARKLQLESGRWKKPNTAEGDQSAS